MAGLSSSGMSPQGSGSGGGGSDNINVIGVADASASDPTTTSTSYVDIAGATVTKTFTSTSARAFIAVTAHTRNNTATTANAVGVHDSVAGEVVMETVDTIDATGKDRQQGMTFLSDTVTEAERTFKLQWWVAAGTGTLMTTGDKLVRLSVMEVLD